MEILTITSTSFTRESHDPAVPTILTSDAKKAVHEDTATKVSLELVKHESRQFAASRFQICQDARVPSDGVQPKMIPYEAVVARALVGLGSLRG